MWRVGCRLNISVAASFVWRCLSGSAIAPFPHPPHRTQRADFPHFALGQDFTPSATARPLHAGAVPPAPSSPNRPRHTPSPPPPLRPLPLSPPPPPTPH